MRREHPECHEVFVTGTFDDWGKTVQLERVGDVFEKKVDLDGKDKILYKVLLSTRRVTAHTRQQAEGTRMASCSFRAVEAAPVRCSLHLITGG
jgi:hypothetical protein